jgi:transcriptional regulator with XRE-family HTH domain
VNDLAVGRALRRIRQRLAWRQEDVASRAGISDAAYSEMERGQLDRVPLGRLRKAAAVLEIDIHLEARWRGGSLEREVSKRHALMSEAVTQMLMADGWEVRPEVSFNHFGERGIIDLVAWDTRTGTLLLIELKTELTDVNGMLGTADRRRRLAAVIGASCGWEARAVASWVVLAHGRTNRRRLADHRAVLRAAFPGDGRAVRGWLRAPKGSLNALWFLPDSARGGARPGHAPRLRVRRTASSVAAHAIPAGFRGLRNLAGPEASESA